MHQTFLSSQETMFFMKYLVSGPASVRRKYSNECFENAPAR